MLHVSMIAIDVDSFVKFCLVRVWRSEAAKLEQGRRYSCTTQFFQTEAAKAPRIADSAGLLG